MLHLTDTTAFFLASHSRQRCRGSRSSTRVVGGSRRPLTRSLIRRHQLIMAARRALDAHEVAGAKVLDPGGVERHHGRMALTGCVSMAGSTAGFHCSVLLTDAGRAKTTASEGPFSD